ncbi:MAG: hypothetical protein EON87_06835 [Brevundimonas sp.]|nr:MAG: hypothetical protein EON87_06835 [Brevundimonas sp.]
MNLADYWQDVVRRLHARWEQFWFYAFKTRVAVATFLLGALATVGDLVDPFQEILPTGPGWAVAAWTFKIVGFLLALIGLAGIVRWAILSNRHDEDYELRRVVLASPPRINGVCYSRDRIEVVSGSNGAVALNISVDAGLDRGANKIVLDSKPYKWPRELEQAARLAERAMNPLAVDEGKVGLRTEIDSRFVAESRTAKLQPTSYFFDRTTNEALACDILYKKNKRVVWRGRVHFIDDDDKLIPLDEAAASNQLGGSTLLIDQSRMVHFTKQTAKSAESADLLAPTGSGSFDLRRFRDWSDAPSERTFQAFCRKEIERELAEETQLAFDETTLKTVLIGFGRLLYRGGKPEIFAVSALRAQAPMLKISAGERLWTGGHEKISLDVLLGGKGPDLKQVSAPLAANIVALRHYLRSSAAEDLWKFLDR